MEDTPAKKTRRFIAISLTLLFCFLLGYGTVFVGIAVVKEIMAIFGPLYGSIIAFYFKED